MISHPLGNAADIDKEDNAPLQSTLISYLHESLETLLIISPAHFFYLNIYPFFMF